MNGSACKCGLTDQFCTLWWNQRPVKFTGSQQHHFGIAFDPVRQLTFDNVNTQLGRIIKRAGLKVWPKRWQNLRATRATELERIFPSHVVTGWCGHTERIAEPHYWMTTESDFARASTLKSDAHMMQHGAEGRSLGRKPPRAPKKKARKNRALRSIALLCEILHWRIGDLNPNPLHEVKHWQNQIRTSLLVHIWCIPG